MTPALAVLSLAWTYALGPIDPVELISIAPDVVSRADTPYFQDDAILNPLLLHSQVEASNAHFPSRLYGYGVGKILKDSIYHRAIFATTNGGKNWKASYTSQDKYLSPPYFTDSLIGFFASGSSIYQTLNGGQTWTPKKLSGNDLLYAIHFPSQQVGYAVGDNGSVYKTSDQGKAWNKISLPTDKKIFSVYFLDENRGYIAGESGTLLATETGGLEWQAMETKTKDDFYCVYFYDDKLGYVLQRSGTALQTWDGNDWLLLHGVRSAAFLDTKHGFSLTCNTMRVEGNEATRLATPSRQLPLFEISNRFLRYHVFSRGRVTITIADPSGKQKHLINEIHLSGSYTRPLPRLAAGIYIVTFKSGSYRKTLRVNFPAE